MDIDATTNVAMEAQSMHQKHRRSTGYVCASGGLALLSATALLTLPAGGAFGPPSGDECEDAISITDGTTLGTTADNTGSTGDDSSCGFNDTVDEWLEYTATCDGVATATTCNPGTAIDTILSVFDVCGGIELACNDDDASGNPDCDLGGAGINRKSTTSWEVTNGQTYLVRVSGFNDETGDYELTLSCTPYITTCPPGGDGDECTGPLAAASPLVGTTLDNTGSTGDDTECGFADDIDEWYCYTAVADGDVTVSTCLPDTDFDTILAVFRACDITEVACNDDDSGPFDPDCDSIGIGFNRASTVTWTAEAGTPYLIRVSGFGGAAGVYGLSITAPPPPCPADLNSDGTVNVLDLLDILTAWGPNPGHPADLNLDGVVNVLDLLDLLTAWGPC